MTSGIHSTAVVSSAATLDDSVTVGPYAVIEDDVQIGAGTSVGAHAVIRRFTRIGRNNYIDAHAVLGGKPQHTAFEDSETRLVIGDDNVIREGVTIHRAFEPGAATVIGSRCFLMCNAHVGHDCKVGDRVTLTNNVVLGGHVEVGEAAVMGGAAGAHQFLRIGAYSMVAGYVPLRKNVLPFMLVGGDPVRHYRLNTVGLRRNGFDRERIRALEAAFRALRGGDRKMSGVLETDDVRHLRESAVAPSRYGYYGFAGPDGAVRE